MPKLFTAFSAILVIAFSAFSQPPGSDTCNKAGAVPIVKENKLAVIVGLDSIFAAIKTRLLTEPPGNSTSMVTKISLQAIITQKKSLYDTATRVTILSDSTTTCKAQGMIFNNYLKAGENHIEDFVSSVKTNSGPITARAIDSTKTK